MKKSLNIIALIPARSGSKGIPHKNIRLLQGKPLLAHSIEHALGSKLITRVIVSTDSVEYAEIARQYGAETPFIRPDEISQDLSTDLEVFIHALHWLQEYERYQADILVHLRPTYPFRSEIDIDCMIQQLIDDPTLDSVRSVTLAPETPFKMWFLDEGGHLKPVVKSDLHDPYNMPRQALPQVYLQNAAIDVVRASVILEQNSTTGSCIGGYVMEHNFDIDTELQFEAAQAVASDATQQEMQVRVRRLVNQLVAGEKPIFCFDIDGIIANLVPNGRYQLATPCSTTIEAVRTLYEKGCHIILFTARGSATGLDWQEVTRRQMQEWGVPYHELRFGKPAAEYYIDDRLITLEQVFELAAALDAE